MLAKEKNRARGPHTITMTTPTPTPTPIDVVLYHHPCTDGAASAYVLSRYCRRVFGTEPLCIGVFAGGG